MNPPLIMCDFRTLQCLDVFMASAPNLDMVDIPMIHLTMPAFDFMQPCRCGYCTSDSLSSRERWVNNASLDAVSTAADLVTRVPNKIFELLSQATKLRALSIHLVS